MDSSNSGAGSLFMGMSSSNSQNRHQMSSSSNRSGQMVQMDDINPMASGGNSMSNMGGGMSSNMGSMNSNVNSHGYQGSRMGNDNRANKTKTQKALSASC